LSLYHLNVTVHLLAALLWLGGMFFLALVGAPALRKLESPALRARIFHELGVRFRTVGWWCIAVLVATGLVNLHFRGLLHGDALLSADFWSSRYGNALAWKLVGVTGMITVSWIHDFVVGPAASRAAAASGRESADGGGDGAESADGPRVEEQVDEGEVARLRRRASWLARANGVLGIVVVWAAVRLARGG
jgi:putative copper export protein